MGIPPLVETFLNDRKTFERLRYAKLAAKLLTQPRRSINKFMPIPSDYHNFFFFFFEESAMFAKIANEIRGGKIQRELRGGGGKMKLVFRMKKRFTG